LAVGIRPARPSRRYNHEAKHRDQQSNRTASSQESILSRTPSTFGR
jgi:hypothetical protein